MKISNLLVLPLLAGSLHGQTLKDPVPSGEDPATLLELPAAKVIGEDGKSVKPDETADADSKKSDEEGEPAKTETTGTTTTEQGGEDAIRIQVEKTTGRGGARQSKGKVKVYSPWPAKPISNPPVGWKFAPAPKDTESFRTTVKLASGNSVDLSITPYVLVPVVDGHGAIKISEPGYDPTKKYTQENTIGVMLQNSTAEIENHEKHVADSIKRLQQLLSSLPRQEQ
ncbi:hypothetical protein NT6N_35470 [Oceaniferula spumae]|uniref:Uncharacterized protein n=1 Tax=Oceaniferula spumae TaxID=2979115 RepID=A0AAT9FRI9_9BACT